MKNVVPSGACASFVTSLTVIVKMVKRKVSQCDGESTSADGSGSGSSVSTPEPDTSEAPAGLLQTAATLATKKQRLSSDERLQRITDAARTIIECLDEDPNREGLAKTPLRFAKALLHLTSGYATSPTTALGDAEFHENHSEMVLLRNIETFSTCEHHLLPFYGRCHVAYIPNGTVIGLSKIARIIDIFSHRLQVQERLTTQIADAILDATRARGVMVYLSCSHMCMVMRGVKKIGVATITTAARGCYSNDVALRQEFLTVINSSSSVS